MRTYLISLLVAHPLGGTLMVDAFVGTKMSSSLFSVPTRTADATSSPALSAFENDDIQEESRRKKAAGKMSRLTHKDKLSKTFATGDDLKNLRLDLESLRQNLQWAEALKDETRIESLQKAIKKGENRDPGWMYTKALKLMAQAKVMKDVSQEEKDALSEKWTKIAASAREYLPQFGLEGLWVGTYGERGAQVINVTYSEDTLHATKVTGDRNVPRGEATFTVDLSPLSASALPPIQLMSDQQRTEEYNRYPGRGQVSKKGFKDNRYVEGQMILLDDKFSFVWIPTKHQVLFTRPSPEMTLRLLRDTISKEDELENMRKHISSCFDMDLSTCIARQQDPTNFEPIRRITLQTDLDKAEKMVKKHNEKNIFWQLNQWRKYLDQSLDSH